jgi:glucoside 3-dehydrogenase (cytochrome c) catalytic subunit
MARCSTRCAPVSEPLTVDQGRTMNLIRLLHGDAQPAVDLTRTYDAIVIGSGAAGGMAAHVLTSRGMKVLMLEAGKKLDINTELKSTEWPYEHPRRGDMPPGHHALSLNEYTIRQPPYAADSKFTKVYSYVQGWGGSDYSKNIVVDEKDHPYTGTSYAWVRARCLGGKTNIWGRLALRLSDYDFKAKTHDGYGEDWPISYKDIEPYYDRVDRYLGISGVRENLPYLPDSIFQRPTKLAAAEVTLRNSLKKMNRVLTPYRAGVTTDGLKHNKYRSRCFGRGACNRRVGGCDIHAVFDSPTGLIYPAMDTGNLTLRTNSIAREILVNRKTGKARGVAFVDSESGRNYEAQAKVVVVAASTLESARLLLLSKSTAHPNGIGNSSDHVGHNFCEHVMGPGVTGLVKERVGKPRTIDDGRPGGFYVPRFRNLSDRNPNFIRAYGFEGSAGSQMFPGNANDTPGFGAAYKKTVRDYAGAFISMGGFGEVLARYDNQVGLDPVRKDKWGIPVLKFNYRFGDNEKKMCEDMANAAQEMFELAGFEVLNVDRKVLTEGWSIHELGTARMGADSKTSVVNQFQQSHDVKNLFVVDGSTHVSASCQNPTWTIMALAWRSCDYLATQFSKGNL